MNEIRNFLVKKIALIKFSWELFNFQILLKVQNQVFSCRQLGVVDYNFVSTAKFFGYRKYYFLLQLLSKNQA